MATEDEILQALIDRTIDAVQTELDWYFGEPRAAEQILDGTGTPALFLRQYLVNSTVTVHERAGVGYAWEVVDSEDYEFEVGGRGLFHSLVWTRGNRNYRVRYTEGFTTMPGDVEQLILDIVAARWNNRENDPMMKSETIGDYSYTRGELEEMPGWSEVWRRWSRGRI
jgi:hypothetical protein